MLPQKPIMDLNIWTMIMMQESDIFHILLHNLLFIQYFVTFLPKTVKRDLAREYAFHPLS